MVQVENLEFGYPEGGFRLLVPSLEIDPGSTVAVIGPSGTGKTPLLNLVAGITAPHRGKVVTQGTDVSSLEDGARRSFRIRNIGLVFQGFELLEYLDVLDNILLPYRVHPALTLDADVRGRAADLAGEMAIADKLRRNVQHLSQGERQRVAICRAVLTEPALVLADEPTGNLDPANTDRVMDLLFNYVQTRGTTLVSVTHEHHLLDRFQRVIDFGDITEETRGSRENSVE